MFQRTVMFIGCDKGGRSACLPYNLMNSFVTNEARLGSLQATTKFGLAGNSGPNSSDALPLVAVLRSASNPKAALIHNDGMYMGH